MQEELSSADVRRASSNMRKTQLESRFIAAWRESFPSLRQPEMQYRFHKTRKWRFDFAWPEYKLAVEIQGGSFVNGGHNRGAGQAKDYEKQREAVKLGWRVLPFNTTDMAHPADVVEFVAEVMCNAKETGATQ